MADRLASTITTLRLYRWGDIGESKRSVNVGLPDRLLTRAAQGSGRLAGSAVIPSGGKNRPV